MADNDLTDILDNLLSDPSAAPDPKWVREVMAQHPTFAVAGALLLRSRKAQKAPVSKDLGAKVMLAAPEPTAMADLADLAESDWANIYPADKPAPQQTTVDTIDTFLATYGNPSAADEQLLEKLIFNPVAPDYFSGTDIPYDPSDPLALPPELDPATATASGAPASEPVPTPAEAPASDEPSALASPLFHQEPLPDNQPVKEAEEPLFMESLAKIFIKQRRYERAFEIINNISLKNPEKSAYFADQLRFLRKLINNQRFESDK